jgi:hypothetical protein
MPRLRFEHTTLVFQQEKMTHALRGAAIVIDGETEALTENPPQCHLLHCK